MRGVQGNFGNDSTQGSSNCHALAQVECNSQVLDAPRINAKKTDSRMNEVDRPH